MNNDDPVRKAVRKVQYDLLVKAAIAEAAGDYIEFDGWNCHDFGDCAGWDGKSRRCECGNRRVYWEMNEDATHVWAVAW